MNADSATTSRGLPLTDFKSGFLVFLIALPLCLGIAMASGFPPVAGVLTAIVGGVGVSFLGSSDLTIKGPAAGLIVIALGAVTELSNGDPVVGYRRALAVGVVAAFVQIAFALLRVATLGVAMSPSVVHGMLAAIGVIIISKQAHTLLGVVPAAKEPLDLLLEVPRSVMHANPEILVLGGISLVLLFGIPLIRHPWAKTVPAPIVVLLFAVPMGLYFDLDHGHDYRLFTHSYHVGPEHLVRLPGSLLEAVVFPDFSVVFSPTSIKYVVMFSLVGTIESTLSVLAVDAMDPKKRASNLNRDLFAAGVGNLVSASIGGLPMISEIVRSKANVDAGAQSPWSNFFHGACLLAFVALVPALLGEIPLAALAAMLVYTGSRLASPAEFAHAKHLGADQLALFLTTLFVTLATDLLVGVGVGLVLKFALHVLRSGSFRAVFAPRVTTERSDDTLRVRLDGAATFMALMAVRRALAHLPDDVKEVCFDFSACGLVDHTFLARLHTMADEWPHAKLALRGLEGFRAASAHPHATRRRART